MTDQILTLLSYPFLSRALLCGTLVSVCAALLGVSLVLKRYSMIGDGLSHAGFGALALASVLGLSPLSVAIPLVVVAAIFLLRLGETGKIKGDAATAFISTGSLATGVLLISLSKSANTDLLNYMFGSILAMETYDVYISVILCVLVSILYIFFYHKIFAITFDETFAKATGTNTAAYGTILAVLTAVTIVLGMRMMGALLISALVIFPALSAMRLCRSFAGTVRCAAVLSVVCFIIGLALSYLLSAPTGATVVVVHILAYVLCSLLGAARNRISRG